MIEDKCEKSTATLDYTSLFVHGHQKTCASARYQNRAQCHKNLLGMAHKLVFRGDVKKSSTNEDLRQNSVRFRPVESKRSMVSGNA